MRERTNPLVLRLRHHGVLGPEDEGRVVTLTHQVREVPEGHDLEWQARPPGDAFVMLEGLACRFKLLADGRRQITDFLLPGDVSDLAPRQLLDQGVVTLAPSVVALVPREAMAQTLAGSAPLGMLFSTLTLFELALMRERIVSLGRRDAYERVGHLLWELYLRLAVVQPAEKGTFSLRLGQQEIADALGLSTVYVSRTIQRLKRDGAVDYEGRRIRIVNLDRLRQIAELGSDTPSLQHLDPPAVAKTGS